MASDDVQTTAPCRFCGWPFHLFERYCPHCGGDLWTPSNGMTAVPRSWARITGWSA